jgi:hypothetical protein
MRRLGSHSKQLTRYRLFGYLMGQEVAQKFRHMALNEIILTQCFE